MAWFHQHPEYLDHELQALREAGYEFHLDEGEREAGRIKLTVKFPLEGTTHDLIVLFPENYPYFPFEIYSPTFPEGRHKNPFNGSICFLKNPQTKWSVTDTLASILKTQVASVVEAHQSPESAGNLEAHEATQISGFFQYQAGTVVFTGDWEISPEQQRGYASFGLLENLDHNNMLRAAMLEVQDIRRAPLATLGINLEPVTTVLGRWLRLKDRLSAADPQSILAKAIKQWPELRAPKYAGGPDIVGILFEEEISYKHYGENWVFLVRTKVKKNKGVVHHVSYLARSDRASLNSIGARIPRLSPIRSQKVLVVGLGSIGSVVAWQMARAGIGGLHLIDFDFIQSGNLPRWMLGWNAIGYPKAHVLSRYIETQYPFTSTKFWNHQIGVPQYSELFKTDSEILSEALDGVDLIFDATAEWCVSHFLSDTAQEKNIPYVWATGTSGAWGGTIGRIVPGHTEGCWGCFQRHMHSGAIKTPNQENSEGVQTAGCFHPTFTGSGFDMDMITQAAVRLAVSTLCKGQESGYSDFDWDFGIADLWDSGLPIAPKWQTDRLKRHPECDHPSHAKG